MTKKKSILIMLIIALVVGFATVSTALVINGIITVGENNNDFNIIFTSAKLDGRKRNDFISEDKKHIKFVSNELKAIDDQTVLQYEVTNTSRNYDADVKVTCISGENEYIQFQYTPVSMEIASGETKSGTLTVSMLKVVSEDREIPITCELVANALERESLGDEYIEPFSKSGMMMTEREDKFWNYKSNITKVEFENNLIPHETIEELTFDVSVNQDKSVMAYLVPNGGTLTTNKDADNKDLEDEKAYTLYLQGDTGIIANKDSSNLFYKFNNLLEIKNWQYFDTKNVTIMRRMFWECRNLMILDLSHLDTSNVTNMEAMFYECRNLTVLNVNSFYTSNVTDMRHMFYGCRNLTVLNVNDFDTSNVTDMMYMFSGCSNLTSLDVSNFDTSNVTNMEAMFGGCGSLTSLDVSNFDTSKVTSMNQLFSGCSNLTTLDVSRFDTNNVTNMARMFQSCSNLTSLDVSNFDTSNVTNMEAMFGGCGSLTSLDVSNFDTSKVTSMNQMFYNCNSLTELDISNFTFESVTNKGFIFNNLKSSVVVKVKSDTEKSWILTLTGNDRPSAWTTNNVKIKEV